MTYEQQLAVTEAARREETLARWLDAERVERERTLADERADRERQHEALKKSLTTMQATLIGILVSTATAAILLALNLAVGSASG